MTRPDATLPQEMSHTSVRKEVGVGPAEGQGEGLRGLGGSQNKQQPNPNPNAFLFALVFGFVPLFGFALAFLGQGLLPLSFG